MAKTIRKVLGALFIITALIMTQIPMPDAFAANAVEDFQRDEDTLVKYTGTATAVSVPDTVKKIGQEAFAGNTDVGSVNVGKNTEEIARSAFSECKYLTSVTIPDHVLSIDDYVFSGCEYLSKVKLGANVEEIGSGVFAGCNSLATIDIDEDNENFHLVKGALYDKDKETLVAYLNGYGADTYNMPDSVKKINAYSFWGNDDVEYIHFSSYLQEIPGYAFSNCTNLQNVTIPYSVDSIEAKAFENCVSLTDVVIPASVTYIHPSAFDGCRKLNIIADKGTAGYTFYQEYLARSAAEQAEKEEVYTPGTSYEASKEDGIVSNDNSGSTSNTVAAIQDPSNVEYMPSSDPLAVQEDASVKAKTLVVGGNAMLFIDSAEAVVYGGNQNAAQSTVQQSQTTQPIENSDYASNNTAVVKPQEESNGDGSQKTITTVGSHNSVSTTIINQNTNTTQNNTNDNKLVVYDQTKGGYLPKYAVLDDKIAAQGYYADSSLSSYTVPSGITSIGEFAFARSSVNKVVIPEGVTSIGYGAFYHCDGLTDVSIPRSVTEIEGYAFENTPYLENFMQNTVSPFLVVGDGILLAYNGNSPSVTVPEGVKQIAPGCFMEHTEISAVTLPESLTIIGEDAFNGCKSLTMVSGGRQVEEIRDRAFMGCPLENYIFPSSIKKIGLRAIDFSVTAKNEEAKVVAFESKELPVISVGKDAMRLSNESYRDDALKDVNIVVVPSDCDAYEDTVLDSSLPGFSGLVVSVEEDGSAKVKTCLATSPEALDAIPLTFTYNGKSYTIPAGDYKISANRTAGISSRSVNVELNGETTDKVTAVFTSEEKVGTLTINTDADSKARIEEAYGELFGGQMPKMEGYSIKLTDVTGYIPITKFGKSELTITMPIPESVEGNRYRVVCLDEDGQLEEVDSYTEDDSIRFTATHLSDYAVYATGNEAVSLSLENGKLVQNYKKDESPDTGDHSLPVNYVFALGVSLIGVILLLYKKKKI